MRDPADTIFAPATARGRAGVAIVRLSGPRAGFVLEALTGRLPEPRQARLARLTDPRDGELIDRALILWFPGPESFTGEDIAEFHIHGGAAVLAGLTNALGAMPGCRLAEPGEFSRRAFEHGKLDLTEAEAIADLVAAETGAQRRQALHQLGGSVARTTADWTTRLIRSLAYLEAVLDFPDEELPADLFERVGGETARLSEEIRHHLTDGRRGEIVRDGLSVAIIGPPNSGKSSLLNALAGRDAAIVSAIAGTTRDVIEIHLDLGGYPIVLADTAGIRESADPIEAEGVERARRHAEMADMCLILLDVQEDVSRETAAALMPRAGAETLIVRSKCDLQPVPPGELGISVKTGQGIDALIRRIGEKAEALLAGPAPLVTRERHRVALEQCLMALDRSRTAEEAALIAEDLRLALRAIGQITGKVDVEDLLDLIFREFCIGK